MVPEEDPHHEIFYNYIMMLIDVGFSEARKKARLED